MDANEHVVNAITSWFDSEEDIRNRVIDVARTAVADDTAYDELTIDTYRDIYRNRRHEIADVVGLAVSDMVSEMLDTIEPEFLRQMVTNVFAVTDSDTRYALGDHYVPEPDDMESILPGDEADDSEEVPDDFPVRVLGPDDKAADPVTCGECGRTWDDSIATGYTPAPAGRCPFEAFH